MSEETQLPAAGTPTPNVTADFLRTLVTTIEALEQISRQQAEALSSLADTISKINARLTQLELRR